MRALLAAGEVGDEALELLRVKLFDVRRAVPAEALGALREVPIWLSRDDPVTPCACYHPSAEWLAENGFDPRKARAVEISNAARFLDWSRQQPAMVLHELAHAYHHRVLGHGHEGLVAALERLRASGLLDDVLRHDGTRAKAYALGNEQELFAELSEAWLGTNDFWPFVRAELLDADPESAALLRELWGG